MIETMILSVTAFVVTNIDDLLMDTLLFAAAIWFTVKLL